jgi:hypothetical protein
MLAAGIKAPVPLEELESHLREEITRRMQSGLDARESFNFADQIVGPAQALKNEFKKVRKTKAGLMINHNRLYSAVLAIFALRNAITAIVFLDWQRAGGGPMRHLSERSLPPMTALCLAYAVAVAATLLARRYRPATGRRLTRILNWALLPVLPGGTVLGFYGLWKVDKEKEQYV